MLFSSQQFYSITHLGVIDTPETKKSSQLVLKPEVSHIRTCLTEWCPGRDSNPHLFTDYPLKVACLPIPPPGQALLACFVAIASRLNGAHYKDF